MFDKISNLCRTCLMSDKPLVSIRNARVSEDMFVTDILRNMLQLVIMDSDGLPENLCEECLQEINHLYSFKIKCNDSEKQLREFLIKTEEYSNINIKEDFNEIKVKKERNEDENDGFPDDDIETEFSIVEIHETSLKKEPENEIFRSLNEETKEESIDPPSVPIKETQLTEQILLEKATEANSKSSGKRQPQRTKNFDCDICKKSFVSYRTVIRHQILHSDRGQFKCDFCPRRCLSSQELLKHCQTHTLEKPFKCQICTKSYTKRIMLNKHLNTAHLEGDLNEIQNQDNTQATCSTNNKEEQQSSDEEQTDDSNDTKRNSESNEMFKDALDNSEYQCCNCGAQFAKQINLVMHYRGSNCVKSEQFHCSECKKIFISLEKRNEHICTPFECSFCKNLFTSNNELEEHVKETNHKQHTKWYQCEQCKKFLRSQVALTEHIRLHTGENPFACKTCSKSFPAKWRLRRHEKRHRQDKPHKCEFCDKAFIKEFELRRHLRSHTGDRPYSCDMCSKTYLSLYKLNYHKLVHTGERPYTCAICQSRFIKLENYNRHKLLKHNNHEATIPK